MYVGAPLEEVPSPRNSKSFEPLLVSRDRKRALPLLPLEVGDTGLSDTAESGGDGKVLLRWGVTCFGIQRLNTLRRCIFLS